MKRLVVFLALLATSALCHAESWVEVRHGAFATPGESLAQVKATLQGTVAAAIRAKGATVPDWSGYLIQYRGARVHGLRVIEIHGSCGFDDASFDRRSEFYDGRALDGAECYLLVYFVIKTKRYSNVVFHGRA
jgi:hypothetical protein